MNRLDFGLRDDNFSNEIGIIYDMDGVVTLSEETHKKAFNMTFEKFNLDKLEWNDYIGKGNKYIVNDVFSKFNINENENYWIYKWISNYQELIISGGPIIIKGFEKFNNYNNYKKIIATGGYRKNAELVLNHLNLDYPIISGEDIKNPKPDPEIFLKAAKHMNIYPSRCIVFEDSIHGIQAAKSAGMKVVALTTTHTRQELILEDPDQIIENFIDFNL